MDRFYLIVNDKKKEAVKTAHDVTAYLKGRGRYCESQFLSRISNKSNGYTDPALIPEDMECIIVLGGDGTLIQAARDTAVHSIPLVGVNLGTLGYLTEADLDGLYPMLDSLMEGAFVIEKRMMLKGEVYRQGRLIARDIALNDIVITRNGSLQVLRFKVFVNGEFLNLYTADGIIYATPTGSTAYNLSAGGPIMIPGASMIVMTPICPHSLHNRSIVLSGDAQVEIELCRGSGQSAVFDGDMVIDLIPEDRILISKADTVVRMLKLSKISFFQTLRKKMSDV